MTPEAYRLLESLFEAACARPRPQHESFIRDVCPPELQDHLRLLLQYDSEASQFLERAPAGNPAPQEDETIEVSMLRPGQTIGAYTIMRSVGVGGMGVVYEALQERPRRRVALKLMHGHAMTRQGIRRFLREAEILGRLQHPAIAQIHEAGIHVAADRRVPYFAMEFVPGLRLTDFVREHKLDVRGSVELMARVCDGVQHAHQNGVIHRDLKPANILVTQEEGTQAQGRLDPEAQSPQAHGHAGTKPQKGRPSSPLGAAEPRSLRAFPKILDFGIARLTRPDAQATTMHTAAGRIVGTLAYMSPEQLSGDPAQVDTRADVYALGVMLYELLAGRRPFALEGQSLPDAIQTLTSHDPPALSTVDRTLRGDLETIVQTAMARDPQRRYASASDLAADLRRFLRDEPIIARPPSTLYQLRKLARRHRAAVAGALLAVAGLTLGTAFAAWKAVEATRQRNDAVDAKNLADREATRARREADRAAAVNRFLQRMLASVDPADEAHGVSVRAVLDEAARRVDAGSLADQPDIEAAVRLTLGNSYRALNLFEAARLQLQKALDIRRRLFPGDHPDVAECMGRLASVFQDEGDYARAEPLFREALAMFERSLGPQCPQMAQTQNDLASMLQDKGDFPAAQSMYQRSVDLAELLLDDSDPQKAVALNNFADFLRVAGRYEESEALFRRVLGLQERRLRPDHPDLGQTLNNLALVLKAAGKLDAAESMYRESLDRARAAYGAEHSTVAGRLNNLAELLRVRNRLDEAVGHFREALQMDRKIYGPDHPFVAMDLNNLGAALRDMQRFDEAEPLYVEALDIRRRIFGAQHPDIAVSLHNLASLAQARGRTEEAEDLYRQAIAMWRVTLGDEHPNLAASLANLGAMKLGLGEPAAAESILREALDIRQAALPPAHPDTLLARALLNLARIDLGRASEVEADARECLELVQQTDSIPEGHMARAWAPYALGCCLMDLSRWQEAEPLLSASLALFESDRRIPPDRRRQALERTIRCCELSGLSDKAEALRARLSPVQASIPP